MDPNANQAPDRWLGCPAFGELVDGNFLPMKTLLSEDYPLPPGYQFTPDIFVKQMRERKIKVGLVINLSFSRRYYDDFAITDHDIEYTQITCRGHNEAPQPKERAEFVKVCEKFLSKNPDKTIAVHCTHGFNRTGFMICWFLCSVRDWSLDAALAMFASKRPPGIYKQDYINELFNFYGDSDDPVMQAPPRPDWDDEIGQMANLHDDDPMRVSAGIVQKEFYEGITDVHLVRDDALKHRIYRHCCQLCNYNVNGNNIAFPGAQPVSMDLMNIQLIKTNRYRVSWKADGNRYMLYIQDEDNIFFLDRALHLWRVTGLKFPKFKVKNSHKTDTLDGHTVDPLEGHLTDTLEGHLTDTLVDGEMVTDIYEGKKIPRYLIYDVISFNGNIVSNQHFDKRCSIKNKIVEARFRAKYANLIPREGEPFKVADKGFFYIQDSIKTWKLDVTHEKDGLIYQPVDAPYTGGTCPNILKWKPPNLNSIDFRLVIREERQNGCIPETFAYLHVSNRADPITKFKLDKDQQSYHQYNNKIVEMTLNNQKWIIMRERTDKLTANSWETASAVFKSIRQPVTEKYLFDFVASIPPESKR